MTLKEVLLSTLHDEYIVEKKEITYQLTYDVNINIQETEEEKPPPENEPPSDDLPPSENELPSEELSPNESVEKVYHTSYTLLNEETVMVKDEGEFTIDAKTIRDITSSDILFSTLSSEAKKANSDIFNEFVLNLFMVAVSDQYQQLADDINKESIFIIKIHYGPDKNEGVGIKISKQQNSDLIERTLSIDGINTSFSKAILDQKIMALSNVE